MDALALNHSRFGVLAAVFLVAVSLVMGIMAGLRLGQYYFGNLHIRQTIRRDSYMWRGKEETRHEHGDGIEWTDATWNPIVGCSICFPGLHQLLRNADGGSDREDGRQQHYACPHNDALKSRPCLDREDGNGASPYFDRTASVAKAP